MNTSEYKISLPKRRDHINLNAKESLSSSEMKYIEIDYVSSERSSSKINQIDFDLSNNIEDSSATTESLANH